MVRTQKKTATPANKVPLEEKRELFALIRTLKSNKPRIVLRSSLVTNKKIEKLEPGDEVSVRQGANRVHGVILAIGSENECKQSLAAIEKLNQIKSKSNSKKKPVQDEQESEGDDPIESDISNEDAVADVENSSDDDDEDNVLLIDKQGYTNDNDKDQSTKLKSSSQHLRSTLCSGQSNDSSTKTSKRKDSLDEEEKENQIKKYRPSYLSTLPVNIQATFQRRIDILEGQILEYQTTWMPRPVDQATISYLVDIGKILSGENESNTEDKGEHLLEIMEILDMTEKELDICKGKNIRITVRQIMKAKYPSPPIGFKFADVKRDFVHAARAYARLVHPQEEKRFTDGQLNHAMGNVFASQTYRKSAQ